MVTYFGMRPSHFFFDSVATTSLKAFLLWYKILSLNSAFWRSMLRIGLFDCLKNSLIIYDFSIEVVF